MQIVGKAILIISLSPSDHSRKSVLVGKQYKAYLNDSNLDINP